MTTDNENRLWAERYMTLPAYQQVVIVAALIGALEGVLGVQYTPDDILGYFDEVIFREQMLTRKEP